ncbi:MBL fold metallo-hydrolase [Candidatus Babeliales bacterium]|nr:MBL fold metallo-hydrolase [Candidatus Babeliales bacterium]
MKITFLGATQEVTGSKYLVQHEKIQMLVDCGMYQGSHDTKKRNWYRFPVEPHSIQAIVLTHAHLDHTGYIPRLVKEGFKGAIYCSQATYDLCAIVLKDSASIQEEDFKSGLLRQEPLYSQQDVYNSLALFHIVPYEKSFNVGGLTITLISSEHIVGSSFVQISDGVKMLTFSGDLSGPRQLLMKAPPHIDSTDYLVLESTYGDRLTEPGDPMEMVADIVNTTIARKGVLIIPAFAIGRTQTMLYILYQLKKQNKIPNIPIFLDSPEAISVTSLLCNFLGELKISEKECQDVLNVATYVRTGEQSKNIDHRSGSVIIIAGSGMAEGGRVLHHFARFISDAKNTVLFVGFQAPDTRGKALIDGAEGMKIDGVWYNVHAAIKNMDLLSAHADYNDILQWLTGFQKAPQKVFLTHGDLPAAQFLKKKIEEKFGWPVVIPKHLESFDLE